MNALRVGFHAFDPHELLVHFVAERAGIYRELELEVELVDLRAGNRPCDATVACGAALLAAFAGAPIRILLVASRGPLFWLYRRKGGAAPDPNEARVATYPPGTPPGQFLQIVLGGAPALLPARDDLARAALVRAGEADFALLSSATPPSRVNDLWPLFCLADRLPVPTTGLATNRGNEQRVRPLVDAHRLALGLLTRDRDLAQDATTEAFGFDAHEASWAVATARSYFTSDGRAGKHRIEAALTLLGGTTSPYAASALCGG